MIRSGATVVGSPPEVRAMLTERGPWSGELEALDVALEEMGAQSVRPLLAVVWSRADQGHGPRPQVLVVADEAMVVGTMTGAGVATAWYVSAPTERAAGAPVVSSRPPDDRPLGRR